ncbi:MAG: MarR family transcriptional regulator [Bacteroidales bacterium]|nr:MarR family transcriptional regulator [Bacteroidales bacterium]
MSNKYELLSSISPMIEMYENETDNADLCQFSLFLYDKVTKPEQSKKDETAFDKNNYLNYQAYDEVAFSTLLTGLFRFAKHYLKKAFSDGPINTIDEFGFLATLLKEGALLKHELIDKHLLEISSGSEIIKRLIKNELIFEFPDEEDRRAKRVALTDKGKLALFNAFDDMHKVSEIVIGNLSKTEIETTLKVFKKLTYFHQQIHKTDRNTTLNEIHKKYIQ